MKHDVFYNVWRKSLWEIIPKKGGDIWVRIGVQMIFFDYVQFNIYLHKDDAN